VPASIGILPYPGRGAKTTFSEAASQQAGNRPGADICPWVAPQQEAATSLPAGRDAPLGREVVLDQGVEDVIGPVGAWVRTQRPLTTATSRRSPSSKIRFSSHPLALTENFLCRPGFKQQVALIYVQDELPMAPLPIVPGGW